jgi:hypothetical protein
MIGHAIAGQAAADIELLCRRWQLGAGACDPVDWTAGPGVIPFLHGCFCAWGKNQWFDDVRATSGLPLMSGHRQTGPTVPFRARNGPTANTEFGATDLVY